MTDEEATAVNAEIDALKQMAENDPEQYATSGMNRMKSLVAGLHRRGPDPNPPAWHAALSRAGQLPVK
jgi:hypothetical protein